MTAPEAGWIDLYHPGVNATHRSTEDAYASVWQAKGWLPLDVAASAAVPAVLADPAKASTEDLALVLNRLGLPVDTADRAQLIATAGVAAQHVGADTPAGQALAQLGVTEAPAVKTSTKSSPKSTPKDGE